MRNEKDEPSMLSPCSFFSGVIIGVERRDAAHLGFEHSLAGAGIGRDIGPVMIGDHEILQILFRIVCDLVGLARRKDEMITGFDRIGLAGLIGYQPGAGQDNIIFRLGGMGVVRVALFSSRDASKFDIKGLPAAPRADVLYATQCERDVLAQYFERPFGRFPMFEGNFRLIDEMHIFLG